MKEGHSHNLPLLISDYDIIIGQLGVVGMAWLLEVNVEHIGLVVAIHQDLFVGDIQEVGHKCSYLLNAIYFCRCHTFFHL